MFLAPWNDIACPGPKPLMQVIGMESPVRRDADPLELLVELLECIRGSGSNNLSNGIVEWRQRTDGGDIDLSF